MSGRSSTPSLLGIPQELRDLVYKLYFAQPYLVLVDEPKDSAERSIPRYHGLDWNIVDHVDPHLYTNTNNSSNKPPTKWSSSRSGLHLVCRQLYQETIGHLYENVTFVFNHGDNGLNTLMRSWENTKHPDKVQHIAVFFPVAHVNRPPGIEEQNTITRLTAYLPNIEDVRVVIKTSPYGPCYRSFHDLRLLAYMDLSKYVGPAKLDIEHFVVYKHAINKSAILEDLVLHHRMTGYCMACSVTEADVEMKENISAKRVDWGTAMRLPANVISFNTNENIGASTCLNDCKWKLQGNDV